MRTYFAPCGIGLGHAARLLPIAEALEKDGGMVHFSTYEDPIPYVKSRGFPVVSSPPIRFEYREDGIFDVRRTFAKGPRNLLSFLGQVAFETTSIEAFKPDVVISDSRLSTLVAARLLNIPRILMINQLRVVIPHMRELTKRRTEIKNFFERIGLEVLTTLWNSSQRILIPDFPHPYTISKANLLVSKRGLDRVTFIGPIIARRPERLPSKASLKDKLGFPSTKPVIFANYNGTPRDKATTTKLLDPLLGELSDEFCIVISHGTPNGGTGNRNKGSLRIYDWLPEKYEMLRACDIFVSTCGHTSLAEAMYYGVPTLLLPTKGHTERIGNANSVEGFGVGIMVQQDELSIKALKNAAQHLMSDDSFQTRALEIQKEVMGFNAIGSAISAIRAARV